VHGPKGYRRLTEFGTQLKEKQKTRFMYGVMEKQLRRYYDEAIRKTGNTAENFLRGLERRLDNTVFRMGFAKTRAQARQMVSHGLVQVNGKRLTIPSYQVRVGETVGVKPALKQGPLMKSVFTGGAGQAPMPSWLDANRDSLSGKVLSMPAPEDFPQNLNMTLVVEYYSR
jgi:small subunit ribosomal protein S4